MIIIYDKTSGMISQIVFDPVPEEMRRTLAGMPEVSYLDKPPIPDEPTPDYDAEGNPIMVTVPQSTTITDDEGNETVIELPSIEVPSVSSKSVTIFEVDAMTQYVVDGEIVPRPTFGLEAEYHVRSGDTLKLDIPVGTMLGLGRQPLVKVETSPVEFEAELLGEFSFNVIGWPYIDAKFKVIVNEV